MSLIQIIILALIQGISEFLPISSSAHLILLPSLTDYEDQGVLIDVAVHVGSLGAVILYFREEVGRMVRALPDLARRNMTADAQLALYLIVATIPAILFGAALSALDLITALRSIEVIAATSIIFGILLYFSDTRAPNQRNLNTLNWRDVLIIGFSQMLALIPGTSRSGITMTAGRALGYERREAARFSMLLSIPIILASGVFQTMKLIEGDTGIATAADAGLAAALSFLSALASIWILMKLLQRMSFTPFVIYRLALGLGLLAIAYL